jgi:hypothetical protein
MKTGSVVDKLIGGIHRNIYSKAISKDYFYFYFQNEESRLKTYPNNN